MGKFETAAIVDGQLYQPGEEIPEFGSIKCVDTSEPRKYIGNSKDASILNDVIAKPKKPKIPAPIIPIYENFIMSPINLNIRCRVMGQMGCKWFLIFSFGFHKLLLC